MKSLCIVLPTLIGGGMERVASELANYYAETNRFKVTIILYGNKIGTNYSISSKVDIITNKRKFNNKLRFFTIASSFYFLRSTINFLKPDFILSFGELWNNFVMLSLLGNTKNVYLSDRCQPDKSIGWFHDNLRRILYPLSKGLIVQTEYAYKIYSSKRLNKNISCIPNPIKVIDKDQINTLDKRENIILSVGRLIRTKHFDLLIKYFSEIDHAGWKLVIVGDNNNDPGMIKKLEDLAVSYNVSDKVELVGHRSDVMEFYNRSKIFAFTSSSEGFPNVLVEALSYGLPLVSFDCPSGPAEIIKSGQNGFLVPLFDQTAYKEALSKLMTNEDLLHFMSKNAYDSAKKYSIIKISQRIIDFFESQNEA